MTIRSDDAARHHDVADHSTRLDLPLLLPEVKDERDACVARLVRLLQRRAGVKSVHVVGPGTGKTESQLCLHYDPDKLSLERITSLARSAGAQVTERYGHVLLPFHSISTEDAGTRLESELRALPGVTAAAVNLAGQVARVEFDRRMVDRAAIERLMNVAAAPTDASPAIECGWYKRNRELAWSLASGALLSAAWLLETIASGSYSR